MLEAASPPIEIGAIQRPTSKPAKRCSKCGQWKPRAEFNRDRWKSDGLKSQCKACRNLSKRRCRARKRGRAESRTRREIRFRWIARRLATWDAHLRLVDGEGYARWRAKNQARRQATVESMRRRWFAANRFDSRVWHQQNRDLDTARRQSRRVEAIRTTINDLSAAQWAWLLDAYGHRCAYCGEPCAALTPDHVVPLARGGHNTLSNVAPACLGCNTRKQARTPDEAGMSFVIRINVTEHYQQQRLM